MSSGGPWSPTAASPSASTKNVPGSSTGPGEAAALLLSRLLEKRFAVGLSISCRMIRAGSSIVPPPVRTAAKRALAQRRIAGLATAFSSV